MRSAIALATVLALAAASPVPSASPLPTGAALIDNDFALKFGKEGDSCRHLGVTTDPSCGPGLICEPSRAADALGTCIKEKEDKPELAKEGDKCGITLGLKAEIQCEAGLKCKGAAAADALGTCVKDEKDKAELAKEGDSCGMTRGLKEEIKCEEGLKCEGATAADALGTCIKAKKPGKPKQADEGESCGVTRGQLLEIKCKDGLQCKRDSGCSQFSDCLGTCTAMNADNDNGNENENEPKPGEKGANCETGNITKEARCNAGLRCVKNVLSLTEKGTCQPIWLPQRPGLPVPTRPDLPLDAPKLAKENENCDFNKKCEDGLRCALESGSGNRCLGDCPRTCQRRSTSKPGDTENEPTEPKPNDPGAKREGAEGDACTYGPRVMDICGEGLICGKELVGGSECINPDAPCPGVCQPKVTILPFIPMAEGVAGS